MHRVLTVLATIGAVFSQAASAQQGNSSDPVRAATFAPSLHLVLDSARRLQSGAYVIDLRTGTGAVVDVNRPVTLQFTVWLANGTQVQALTPPATHTLGNGTFLEGVEQAMAGMKTGGKRRVILPPWLGYGDQAVGAVPANSILVIDVTVVDAAVPH